MAWTQRAAVPLWIFERLVTPIRVVVRTISDLIVRLFGVDPKSTTSLDLSEAEFRALVDAGSAEGEVDARERRLIHKVFEFGDKTIADVMVPRARVFALSYDLPLARLAEQIADRGFSRVPIYHKTLDNVRGILYAKDMLIQATGGATTPRRLIELLHAPLFVVQTMPLKRLFRIFKQRHIHMALVVNEYGKVSGLVTLEDLLDEIFGALREEREFSRVESTDVDGGNGEVPVAEDRL
jgi:putative hemolysin